MNTKEKSRLGKDKRKDDFIHLVTYIVHGILKLGTANMQKQSIQLSHHKYSYKLTYFFLNCMKGQTTEKYLSMVRDRVIYTLAVMLVLNMQHMG